MKILGKVIYYVHSMMKYMIVNDIVRLCENIIIHVVRMETPADLYTGVLL
jgi:hypothetical protein